MLARGQRSLPPVPESQKVGVYSDPRAAARQYAEGQGSLKWLLQEHKCAIHLWTEGALLVWESCAGGFAH